MDEWRPPPPPPSTTYRLLTPPPPPPLDPNSMVLSMMCLSIDIASAFSESKIKIDANPRTFVTLYASYRHFVYATAARPHEHLCKSFAIVLGSEITIIEASIPPPATRPYDLLYAVLSMFIHCEKKNARDSAKHWLRHNIHSSHFVFMSTFGIFFLRQTTTSRHIDLRLSHAACLKHLDCRYDASPCWGWQIEITPILRLHFCVCPVRQPLECITLVIKHPNKQIASHSEFESGINVDEMNTSKPKSIAVFSRFFPSHRIGDN